MRQNKFFVIAILTAFLLPPSVGIAAEAATIIKQADYLQKTVPEPAVSSVGGEWVVIGLARSQEDLPEGFAQGYYRRLEERLQETKGILHTRKYTEYARAALAVTALGGDAQNVGGYNLLAPLADFDQTIWQGLNGAVFALLALDSGDYPIPVCQDKQKQATRQKYVDYILKQQLADGGFALSGKQADADMTAMVLQALAKYQDQPKVKLAGKLALGTLSRLQDDKGGFASWGQANAESTAQVLMALCEWGVAVDEPRFVKGGHTVVDNLLTYQLPEGGFKHTLADKAPNAMATEQAFYALVNYQRMLLHQPSLYRMNEADVPAEAV